MNKKVPIKLRLNFSLNEKDKANVWKALFKYILEQHYKDFKPLADKDLP